MRAHLTPADFGPRYFCGRVRSNYANYEKRQGRKIGWLPFLWTVRHLRRRFEDGSVAHLDIGCAFGFFLKYTSSYVSRSVGVDLSSYAVEKARELFPTLEFVQGSASALPFDDETFHIVTSFDTLEHVPDVLSALREAHRVLRPDGVLLLRVPYSGFRRRLLGWRDRDTTHVSVLSFPAWAATLKKGGFAVERAISYPISSGAVAVFVARKTASVDVLSGGGP